MRVWRGIAKPGEWKAQCDRCGFDYLSSQMREEWTGHIVCKDCWEPRHPQDFVRGVKDDPSTPWSRPASSKDVGTSTFDDDGITYVGDTNTTLTSSSDRLAIYNTTLTANRTVSFNTSGLKDGDRFNVTKDEGSTFTVDVGGLVTLSVDSSAIVEFNGTRLQHLRTYVDPL